MNTDSSTSEKTIIRGSRTYLVPFDHSHLNDPRYLSWLRDYEVMKFIGREEYLDQVPFSEVKQYVEDVWNNKYCFFFAMCSAENNAFIGTTKINYFTETGFRDGIADIGIMIGDRNSWGKGLATDALFATCHYAFTALGARKLTAGALAPNTAVIKAFNNIGFREEGRLRKKVRIKDEYVDHVLMGCFVDELKSND